MIHAEMLIDGHFIGGPCDQATGKQVVRNPYDGSLVGTAAEGGLGELRGCLDAAWDAYQTWRFSSVSDRHKLLRRVADLVRERSGELVDLLTDEVGKPVTWSQGEVKRTAITFDLAAMKLDNWNVYGEIELGNDPRGKDYEARIERFPIGPVLAIVPYNWPFNLAAHKIAPALAVGNTLILKPSPLAPLSTLALARLIHEAGCPPGVLNAWNGPTQVINKVSHDPRCRMVSFTGSPAVGWKVKQDLPPDKKVTLELGGNGFAMICNDADLAWATSRCIAGGYGYAGQVCIAVQHVLVESAVYEKTKQSLIEQTNACPWGDPRSEKTVCGPMISPEAADRVEEWIIEAVSQGAKVIAGGGREGNLIKPTLLESVPSHVRLSNEEVFGPVLTLQPFSDFDQAIRKINESKYGIHAGVFTNDLDRFGQAFRELQVGGLVVNDYPTLRFDNLPYGGLKQSGFGREGVRSAMEEMTEWKSLVVRKG
ncbi:MAG: aldehyde dehydrogenase family protein [Chlorobia bacterium]|nr:aldehyde dehydrogenase family protein [Fimbriimonadaceae bacterium]